MRFPRPASANRKISHALSTSRNQRNGKSRSVFLVIGTGVVALVLVGNVLLIRMATVGRGKASVASAAVTPQSADQHLRKTSDSAAAAPAKFNPVAEPEQKHHLIFSTSCHFKQDWQSYLFFYQAMVQGQPGDVTRIVSGCSDEDRAALEAFHKEKISVMSDRFHVHFTPDFSRQTGSNFQVTKYWNKPFGVRHWLENTFGYSPDNMSTNADDDVVILVDPDMLLQRPIINDFKDAPLNTWTKYFQEHPDEVHSKVEHGKPISQIYAFGKSWLSSVKHNLTYVVGKNSPAHDLSMADAARFYPSGPPYMATGRDMYNIAYHWTQFTPRIFELTPVFMSEMHGYSMASAHLGLPHQMAKGFMASNVQLTSLEGWDFLDDVDPLDICDMDKSLPNRPLVIHFCQRYALGEFFQSKYKTHHEILSCDHPLLEQPPKDAVVKFDHSHYGNGEVHQWTPSTQKIKWRHGFMVCNIMEGLNGAATWYKQHHCSADANYDKVWNFLRDEGDDIEKKKRKLAGKH